MPEPNPVSDSAAVLEHLRGTPRPVFEGDWTTATGVQKGDHSERVRLWKQANGISGAASSAKRGDAAKGEAQSRMVALDEARAADVAALQAIIDGSGSLNADRIRALDAKQRMLSAAAIEQASDVHSDLVALRDALLPLPEAERVGALTSVLRVKEEEAEAASLSA